MRQSDTVRWSLKVSRETDVALRTFLAQRGLKKGDLSKFVEDAVRWQVLNRTIEGVREHNAGAASEEVEAAVEEALAFVRAAQFRTPT